MSKRYDPKKKKHIPKKARTPEEEYQNFKWSLDNRLAGVDIDSIEYDYDHKTDTYTVLAIIELKNKNEEIDWKKKPNSLKVYEIIADFCGVPAFIVKHNRKKTSFNIVPINKLSSQFLKKYYKFDTSINRCRIGYLQFLHFLRINIGKRFILEKNKIEEIKNKNYPEQPQEVKHENNLSDTGGVQET